MTKSLILISEREEDAEFARFVAATNGMTLFIALTPEQIDNVVTANPQCVIFWEADGNNTSAVANALNNGIQPMRVFAITDNPLNTYPNLIKLQVFSHHIFRRFEGPARVLIAKLAASVLLPSSFGLERYFPEGVVVQQIELKRSSHKRAAVEAMQNFFTKQNVNSRLAALVAQATDELIMNAIFDAPVLPNGQPSRRGLDRSTDFELSPKETVQVRVASGGGYVGISVTDHFGSLKKNVLLNFLGKDYHDEAYVLRKGDPGAGLGLHGIIQSGLSLLFVTKIETITEVMMFFNKEGSYKDFRQGFRFLSFIAP